MRRAKCGGRRCWHARADTAARRSATPNPAAPGSVRHDHRRSPPPPRTLAGRAKEGARTRRRGAFLPGQRPHRAGTGLVLEAVGLRVPLGSGCRIELSQLEAGESRFAEAEVVGFSGERVFLMPLAETSGLTPGARVFPLGDD